MAPDHPQTDLHAHIWHILRNQERIEREIRELKRDREAMIRRFAGWVIWVLSATLGALASHAFGAGSPVAWLFNTIRSSLGSP